MNCHIKYRNWLFKNQNLPERLNLMKYSFIATLHYETGEKRKQPGSCKCGMCKAEQSILSINRSMYKKNYRPRLWNTSYKLLQFLDETQNISNTLYTQSKRVANITLGRRTGDLFESTQSSCFIHNRCLPSSGH